MEKLILSECDFYIKEKYKIVFDVNSGYFRLYMGNGKYVYLHRFILKANKGEIVDHKDRNKANNSRENLRIVSKSVNNFNRDVINKFGRGIYFDKSGNRFRACISYKNKTIKLGSFKTEKEAKIAYNVKAKELRGDDAYIHEIT